MPGHEVKTPKLSCTSTHYCALTSVGRPYCVDIEIGFVSNTPPPQAFAPYSYIYVVVSDNGIDLSPCGLSLQGLSLPCKTLAHAWTQQRNHFLLGAGEHILSTRLTASISSVLIEALDETSPRPTVKCLFDTGGCFNIMTSLFLKGVDVIQSFRTFSIIGGFMAHDVFFSSQGNFILSGSSGSTVQFSQCTFVGNESDSTWPLLSFTQSAVFFDNCTFLSATKGSIDAHGAIMFLFNSKISDNQQHALSISQSLLFVYATAFQNNFDLSGGAAVYASDQSRIRFQNCIFADNVVSNSSSIHGGGAVLLLESSGVFDSVEFNRNEVLATTHEFSSYLGGGAVLCESHISPPPLISFNQCVFSSNSAKNIVQTDVFKLDSALKLFGGAVAIHLCNLLLQNSNFTGNTAREGGGLYAFTGSVGTVGCRFVKQYSSNSKR